MREILFKAKTINGKRWVQGYYFAKPILERYFIICDEAQWEVDPSTICQYTGLTDKNGQKIWENDVIKECENTYVVFWDNCNSEYGAKNDIDSMSIACLCTKWAEVIGNVFDNADLVKE